MRGASPEVELIGFHLNRLRPDGSTKRRRRRPLSPSLLNRVTLIDARLRLAGYRLFLHSPRDIRADRPVVPGYLFEDGAFRPIEAGVPAVNGNWTHRTRRLLDKGMGYATFRHWAAESGIGIYVPHAFSELLANKLETYKLVRAYHTTLHPHCEAWAGSARQLEHFIETGPLTFIKPRNGNKGERIIAIHRGERGLRATRYDHGTQQRIQTGSIEALMAFIGGGRGGNGNYVIQHGVETARCDGSTFDVRVTMINDGRSWDWLHEARVSPPGSDVSNVSQGGDIAATEALLLETMSAESSGELLRQIRNESFGLAMHLERLHPGEIPEVAFDFAVDREGRLRLLEINTKPGLAGIGSNVGLREKRPEQEALFERWVYPHARSLADFLSSKAERRRGGPWCRVGETAVAAADAAARH